MDPSRDRTQSRTRTASAMLSAPPETATASRGWGSNGPNLSKELATVVCRLS